MFNIQKFNFATGRFADDSVERRPMYCRLDDDRLDLYYDAYVIYGNLAIIAEPSESWAEVTLIEPHPAKPGYWREASHAAHIDLTAVDRAFFDRLAAARNSTDLIALMHDYIVKEAAAHAAV